MPDSKECASSEPEPHGRNRADRAEEREAKRRERTEEVNAVLRSGLLIWDLVREFVH